VVVLCSVLAWVRQARSVFVLLSHDRASCQKGGSDDGGNLHFCCVVMIKKKELGS